MLFHFKLNQIKAEFNKSTIYHIVLFLLKCHLPDFCDFCYNAIYQILNKSSTFNPSWASFWFCFVCFKPPYVVKNSWVISSVGWGVGFTFSPNNRRFCYGAKADIHHKTTSTSLLGRPNESLFTPSYPSSNVGFMQSIFIFFTRWPSSDLNNMQPWNSKSR